MTAPARPQPQPSPQPQPQPRLRPGPRLRLRPQAHAHDAHPLDAQAHPIPNPDPIPNPHPDLNPDPNPDPNPRPRTAAGRRPQALPAPLAAAFLSTALLLATACTGESHPRTEPTPVTTRPLIVASGADLTNADGVGIRRALIARWNSENPGRQARIVELPYAADGQRSELVGALQSGTAAYDVVNLDVTWIPEFAESGLIRPLDPALVDDDFLPQAAATGRWKERTFAVPFNTDVGLLYYRGSHADLPDDDRLSDLVHGVSVPNREAYTTQLRAYEGLVVNTLEAFWSVEAEIVDRDGRYIGTKDALRAGLGELDRLADSRYLNPESLDADETVTRAQFTDDRSVLMRNWPYAYNRLDATLDPGVPFGVARLPGGYAALGGQDLAVTATSARAGDAADLIAFLTGPSSQRKLLQAGFAAARQSTYGTGIQDTDCTQPATRHYDRPLRSGPEPLRTATPPARPGYTTVLWCALRDAHAHARPASAHYATFTRVLQREVRRMLTKQATIEETAGRLDERLGRALGGR